MLMDKVLVRVINERGFSFLVNLGQDKFYFILVYQRHQYVYLIMLYILLDHHLQCQELLHCDLELSLICCVFLEEV